MFTSRLVFEPGSLRKNKWTPEEDDQLRHAVRSLGTDSWNRIAMFVPSRTGKQCRERWIDQISPNVFKDFWLPEEDALLLRTHAVTGNKWTAIAAQLPGRSALCVKNRWNWLIRHQGMSAEEEIVPGVPETKEREKPKRSQELFDSLTCEDGLFGIAFRKFQAKMFSGIHL
jgi:hypothetical protein